MEYTYDTLCFEDVEVGQVLPVLSFPITVTKCIMTASAARDFQPMHHDRDFAQQKSKTRDMFVGTWFYMGLFNRFITDWAGPEAWFSKLKFKMRQPVCPGDELKVEGKVTNKRVENGKYIVELDMWMSTQFENTTVATAEAQLPTRVKS